MAIIEIQGVSFSYDDNVKALDNITLSIEEGSFVCVLGGNGSGKSTLARQMNALLLPDEGSVSVLGLLTVREENLYDIRSNVGLVFQNPDDQVVASVIEDDVAFGPENLGIPSEQIQRRVHESLNKVGLKGFEKRETAALSGGQKQRVAIAGTLAMESRILVLDEASAMLDPRGRDELARLCRRLNDDGFTIVSITHFMEEAAEADRVVVLNEGKMEMDDEPEMVFMQARRLQELALSAPFSVRMGLALQDVGMPIRLSVDESSLESQIAALTRPDGISSPLGNTPSPLASSPLDASPSPNKTMRPNPLEGDKSPIVTLDDVSFSYDPKRARRKSGFKRKGRRNPVWNNDEDSPWALRNVSLSLYEGDFLGIAGHTGSGKSTLAQLASGILNPISGSVLAYGRNMAEKRTSHDTRRSIGMVFQYPEHQLFAPTVFEDVAFGPRNLGLSADEVEFRVHKAFDLVHLDFDEVRQKSPFELSGGQQRRVALAGVLAMNPDVLILDEPAAGLDPQAHRSLLNLIKELHEMRLMTVAMVSHNMDDLAELCNRIIVLNKGEIVADGSPSLIFSDEEAIRRIGLGVPHTVHLAHRLGILESFDEIPTIKSLAAHIGLAYLNRSAGDFS